MRSGLSRGLLLALSLGFILVAHAVQADKIDALVQTLATTDSYKVKVQICLLLGKSRDPRAVSPLGQALGDENPTVRLVAAEALGKIGDRAGLAALRAAASDANGGVARAARAAIAAIERSGGGAAQSGFFISVGPMANKSHGGGPEATRIFRESLVRELRKTPGVSLDGAPHPRPGSSYYVDGNIVRLQAQAAGGGLEISCDLKVLVATYPQKSILMWTDGGATVQTGRGAAQEQAGTRDCLEAAVTGIRENIASFLAGRR
jgi:hypothetical protein